MKVTVIRAENVVMVDGKPHWVDCSQVPAYVRIYQWEDDRGEIEFVNDGRDVKSFMPNEPFEKFERIAFLVDAWTEAEKAEQDKIAADETAKAEAKAAAKALRA